MYQRNCKGKGRYNEDPPFFPPFLVGKYYIKKRNDKSIHMSLLKEYIVQITCVLMSLCGELQC